MLIKLACMLASIALLTLASFERPSSARCPDHWWLDEGVRANGLYRCAEITPERWERGPRGGWVDKSDAPEAAITSRIYCTNGTHAITNDGMTVGCQR